jgi:hypothetical protein
MAVKDVIFVPREKSKELILATFGKFFESKKGEELVLDQTKFTRSLRIVQGKNTHKGRIRRNPKVNEFLFHETEKTIYIYELDCYSQM